MPSSDALPPPARPPVCGMLMPILIGGCCALPPEISPSVATATVAPRSVLRFIDPPEMSGFLLYWMNSAEFTMENHRPSFRLHPVLSNSPERCQYDLRRERDFSDVHAKRPQRVVHRLGNRRGRA